MQEFDDIKSLWQAQAIGTTISSNEMLAQAKKGVSGIRTRSLLNVLGMLASFAAFFLLFFFFQFNTWTTPAGLAIIIVLVGVYTVILYKDYKLIARTDFTSHPGDLLDSLKYYKLNRYQLYNKLYYVYLAGICIGICLYFYDMLSVFSPALKTGIVVFVVLWITLSATILRRAYLKREKERLDLLINQFERISNQIRD